MSKLEELRQRAVREQAAKASAKAAQAAGEEEILATAVREDLPKWVALLEVAMNEHPRARRVNLLYSPETRPGLFKSGMPAKLVVEGWPSIDVERINPRERLHLYAARITEQLGRPFRLQYEENSERPHSFLLTWS